MMLLLLLLLLLSNDDDDDDDDDNDDDRDDAINTLVLRQNGLHLQIFWNAIAGVTMSKQ